MVTNQIIPEQFTAIGPPSFIWRGGGEGGRGKKNCGGTLFPDNTASLDQRFKHFPANTASLDQRFKHFPANTVLLGEQCDLCCYQTAKARTLCVYLNIKVSKVFVWELLKYNEGF